MQWKSRLSVSSDGGTYMGPDGLQVTPDRSILEKDLPLHRTPASIRSIHHKLVHEENLHDADYLSCSIKHLLLSSA